MPQKPKLMSYGVREKDKIPNIALKVQQSIQKSREIFSELTNNATKKRS